MITCADLAVMSRCVDGAHEMIRMIMMLKCFARRLMML